MPIELSIAVNDFHQIAVWNIDEDLNELKKGLQFNNEELSQFNAISHEKGQKQWLAVRQLARELLKTGDQIVYNELGVPSLEGHDFHISLSHSDEKVALSCNKKHETGIDIQIRNEKIQNIQKKFCTAWELEWINKEDKSDYLHLLWGAKEAIFKYYTTQMPFKMAEIQPFNLKSEGSFEAVRKRGHEKDKFQLSYRIFEGYYLVYLSDIISIEYGTQSNTRKEKARR